MIEQKYKELHETPSDINEHFPVLKRYAKDNEVVELGVRYIVSTWALLAGKPKVLLSVDIKHPNEYGGDLDEVLMACENEGIPFAFKVADSLTLEPPPCDVLFIDTMHTYEQLSQELARYSPRVRKYILMHDTEETEFPDMQKAIREFLEQNQDWKLHKQYNNCHGLTVLKRI